MWGFIRCNVVSAFIASRTEYHCACRSAQLLAIMRGTTSFKLSIIIPIRTRHAWLVPCRRNYYYRVGSTVEKTGCGARGVVCTDALTLARRDWVAFEIVGCLGSPGCAREPHRIGCISPRRPKGLHVTVWKNPCSRPLSCLACSSFHICGASSLSVSTCPPPPTLTVNWTILLDADFLKTGD
ncbi:hypothetical protein M430DRAFT_213208 [Amorphotheca resinae ATCC 22711]|jgi:hypothetical protein|uniref:Uncharacterized protein n=1 Tax=Amorphotheca resinae ATCC 22711 TaxID=857342 RepID=A0A2T3B8D0_AMORE|nr:hypothetical protein M430DRAFT_213208 [Amorphotheca resinae ATCC 22711]PSS23103.1 hypothetical protein M430DRAFT_213208 [Amorphotheca resinae ATCC 22711]